MGHRQHAVFVARTLDSLGTAPPTNNDDPYAS